MASKVDAPPNPLQHVNVKTTREHYAAIGADDLHKAKQRLIEKAQKLNKESESSIFESDE